MPRSAGRLSGQEMSAVLYRDMLGEEDWRWETVATKKKKR